MHILGGIPHLGPLSACQLVKMGSKSWGAAES